jgi:hypothetical protein
VALSARGPRSFDHVAVVAWHKSSSEHKIDDGGVSCAVDLSDCRQAYFLPLPAELPMEVFQF